MECFRQIARLVKSPFRREKQQHKVLEIGPPTDFRKEELPAFFSDDESVASHPDRPDSHSDHRSQCGHPAQSGIDPREGEGSSGHGHGPSTVDTRQDQDPCPEAERPGCPTAP
ncbi:hypothetical protein BO70DRAFT_359345 [Aspergillus heteromorphus CBS 117.55]|uniref:Uncharacterized protein n=1 Tax=Aspergillus heteromorphus CBS 117.55 TaxID=1448321 RepID=A0A317WUZ6_9EURO|nr:uncharacterized protein BO70DRAFT_359345 [Aspergillus heteromorphus CBS 117.55]PWY89037.1 hypothetical protein BO70DRAFT_359345 [Aspergillus heteromorphus CBS 117.55]